MIETYSSGYTASKIRCCSIFEPERKFIAAGGIVRPFSTESKDHQPHIHQAQAAREIGALM